MTTGMTWRVKLDNGNEYGPVEEAKLIQWAQEGRIEPGSLISADGENWIAAPQKPELGMDCLVEVAPGQYFGPFHRKVVQELLETNQLSPDARVFRLSGKTSEGPSDAVEGLKTELKAVQSELDAAREERKVTHQELEKVRSDLVVADKVKAQLSAELSAAKACGKELETALKESGEREKALTIESEGLRTELETARSELETACAELEAARSNLVSADAEKKRQAERLSVAEAHAKDLFDELTKTQLDLEKERETCEELKVKLAKSGKRTGFGGLFKGKSREELSLLERAAQRELAQRRRNLGVSGQNHPNLTVIDV